MNGRLEDIASQGMVDRRTAIKYLLAAGIVIPVFANQAYGENRLDYQDKVKANSELLVRKPSPKDQKILAALERVPDGIQEIININGVTFKLIDGKFKRVPGYEKAGISERYIGVYDPLTGDILLRRNPRALIQEILFIPSDISVELAALHEYGHAVDDIFGRGLVRNGNSQLPYLSLTPDFTGAYKPRKKYIFKQLNSETRALSQTFADKFADFYFSDKTQAKLKNKHPLVFEYFRNFEADVNAGKYAHLLNRKTPAFIIEELKK